MEHDALDRWFNSRRKLWWRSWRWLVMLVWALCLLCLVCGALYQYYDIGNHWFVWRPQQRPFLVGPAHYVWSYYGVILPAALTILWIAGAQAVRSLALPADIAVTTPPREIYRRSLARARGGFFKVLGWPLLTLVVLVLLAYDFGAFSSKAPSEVASFAIYSTTFAGVLIFIFEWQIAMLVRFAPRLGRNWIYLLPLVPIPFTLFFDAMYVYSPGGEDQLSNDYGYVTSVLVAIGLVCGMALAWRIWRAVMSTPRIDGHVAMAGLMTCMSFVSAPLAGAVGPAQLAAYGFSALVHGVCVGNPLRGWTAGGVLLQQISSVTGKLTYNAYMPDSLRLWAVDTTAGTHGMFVLPEVFLPSVFVLMWCLAYYVYSVLVMRHAASVMPKGYTGTWQS